MGRPPELDKDAVRLLLDKQLAIHGATRAIDKALDGEKKVA
jgi:hypothetical protein